MNDRQHYQAAEQALEAGDPALAQAHLGMAALAFTVEQAAEGGVMRPVVAEAWREVLYPDASQNENGEGK